MDGVKIVMKKVIFNLFCFYQRAEHTMVHTKVLWSTEERDFISSYVTSTPRNVNESLSSYWSKCADVINAKFPTSVRNGKMH